MRHPLNLVALLLLAAWGCKKSDKVVKNIPDPDALKRLFQSDIVCKTTGSYQAPEWVAKEYNSMSLTGSGSSLTKGRAEYLDPNGFVVSTESNIRRIVIGEPAKKIDFEILGYPVFNGISKGTLKIAREFKGYIVKVDGIDDLVNFKIDFFPFKETMISGIKAKEPLKDPNQQAQVILDELDSTKLLAVLDRDKHPICKDTDKMLCLVPYGLDSFLFWDQNKQQFYVLWEIKFLNGTPDYPYRAWVVDRKGIYDVLAVMPLFQDLTGKAMVYESNTSRNLVDVDLPGLHDDSPFLCTDSLVTSIPEGKPQAANEFHEYRFLPTSPEFGEVSLFTVLTHYEIWLKSVGFVPWSGTPLALKLYAGTYSQPHYTNPDVDSEGRELQREVIVVPSKMISSNMDGDFVQLDNLWFDSDAVVHERGHGVMFGKVGLGYNDGSDYEHQCLKEAIPDTLMSLYTGDSCLGERICIATTTICYVKDRCLRSASSKMAYLDDEFNDFRETNKFHLSGQVISGLVWDLHETHLIPRDRLGKLLIATLDRMQPHTDFSDFLNSMLAAEKASFASEYTCKILEAARNRNLSKLIDPKYVCK